MKNQNKITVLAIVLNSLFFGAFLFIAVAIVPFWQSLKGADVTVWFNNNFGRFPKLMVPLNLLTFIAISTGLYQNRKNIDTKKYWWLAFIFIFLCSITYPIFFDGANTAISSGNSLDESINSLIDSWETWHYLRSALSFLSLSILFKISLYNK